MFDEGEKGIFLCRKCEAARCSGRGKTGQVQLGDGDRHSFGDGDRHSSGDSRTGTAPGTSPFRSAMCARTRRCSRHALLRVTAPEMFNSRAARGGCVVAKKTSSEAPVQPGDAAARPFWAGTSEVYWKVGLDLQRSDLPSPEEHKGTRCHPSCPHGPFRSRKT